MANGDVTEQLAGRDKLKFVEISNEKYRTYFFPTPTGGVVAYTIDEPVQLNVKRKPEGDSHRVVDSKGAAHYIPAGWIALKWEGKNGVAFSF